MEQNVIFSLLLLLLLIIRGHLCYENSVFLLSTDFVSLFTSYLLGSCHKGGLSTNQGNCLTDEVTNGFRAAGFMNVTFNNDAELVECVSCIRVAPRSIAHRQESVVNEGSHQSRSTTTKIND